MHLNDIAECKWLHTWRCRVSEPTLDGNIEPAPNLCFVCGNPWKRIYRNVPVQPPETQVEIPHARVVPDPVPVPEKKATINTIASEVARRYGLTVDQLRGPRRDARTARVRALAMHKVHGLLGLSSVVIGQYFNREHSTVLSAIRRVEMVLRDDEIKDLKGDE